MRRKSLLALTLTTCLTAPAAAESWYGLYNSLDVITYADADSVSRNGSRATVNIFFSHNYADYHKQTIEFDCQSQQYRVLSASDHAADRSYLSTPSFDSNWQTPEETMLQFKTFSCDNGGRDSWVNDPFADADEYWDYMYYYYGY